MRPVRRSWPSCWSATRRARRRSGGGVTCRADAAELAHRLAREAEAVCRHYLSNGRRDGRYWLVGDAQHAGRSMFVRLKGADIGKGAAGKWTDAATGEHGDLLDVIRESCGLVDFHDVAEEARRFPEPADRAESVPRLSTAPVTGADRLDRKRRDVCSPCRSRSPARSWRRICGDAASLTYTDRTACASIRAATIVPTSIPRPRPGPR